MMRMQRLYYTIYQSDCQEKSNDVEIKKQNNAALKGGR